MEACQAPFVARPKLAFTLTDEQRRELERLVKA
ncbi:MAG: hypothetical protein RIQ93_1979, partial [Verrucomicrobiota bacterium]